MPLLPTQSLCGGRLGREREFASHRRGWTEERRMAGGRQLKAEMQILSKMARRKLGGINDISRNRHSASHQLAWKSECSEPKRTKRVHDPPGEFSHSTANPGPVRSVHDIASLHRPPRQSANCCQLVDRVRVQPAICVDHDNNLQKVVLQVPKTKIKGIPLPNLFNVAALDDFRSSRLGNFCGVVAAIVCDDQEPVAGTQLRCDVL